MGYSKSLARCEFEADYITILRVARTVKAPSVMRDSRNFYSIQQAVFKASIIQLNSSLEKYIQALFENWLESLASNNKCMKHVPPELLWWEASNKQFANFKRYFLEQDEKKLISALSKNSKLANLFDPNCYLKENLSRDSVLDKKYPSVANIERICMRFGLDNVFNELNRRAKGDVRKQFESFADVRTSIAHSFPTDDLTYKDVLNNSKFIERLVLHLDRLLYDKVTIISGRECWK